MHKTLLMSAVAAGTLALAGCASAGSGTATAGSQAPASAALSTSQSSLGTVVVDGKGMTVYSFDKDTIGAATSACTGVCVGLWPELTTTSSSPKVSGVTGKVGTAPTTGGARQLTLNGHRLYTFSGDSQSGQINGEAYMNQWWVLAPSGQLIKKGGAASSSVPSVTY